MAEEIDQAELAEQLLAQAKEQGIELVGPGGLLNQLTEAACWRPRSRRRWPNTSAMTSTTRPGEVWQLPQRHPRQDGADRDRAGADRGTPRHQRHPSIRRSCSKRQRRLGGIDQIVLSLSAEG